MINQNIRGYLRLLLALAVMTYVHRILILNTDLSTNFGAIYYGSSHKAELFQAWWHQYQAPILIGLISDSIFVLPASLIAFVVSPRWMFLPLILLSLFYAANIEHVHYNFSHIRLGTLYMALDPTFVEGSGLTWDILLNLCIIAVIAVVTYRFTRFAIMQFVAGAAAVIMLVAAVILHDDASPLDPGWMQTHPLALTLPSEETGTSTNIFLASALDTSTLTPEPPHGRRLNILVIYLEGVSQHSLENGTMLFLKSLAADNLSFNRYFGAQLQTNNGLYSSLTGYYPNFLTASSPWDTLRSQGSAAQHSLPRVLTHLGYHTAFLQSADLSFMNKAEVLSQIGFEDVKGRETWTDFHSENGWGIDDLGLFEATLSYIDMLPTNRPWFVSLLTSGTHAPYNVPADYRAGEPDRLRALTYADAAAQALMEGLQMRGLLNDTVVIFTADESREPGGKSNLENEILLNWLPLVIVHPNGQVGTIDWPLGTTTFRNLVLRFAGDWKRVDIDALNTPEVPLIFGNYYKSRVFWFDRQRGDFYACYTQIFLCAQFRDIDDLTQLAAISPASVSREPTMQAIFQMHETTN